MNNTLPARQANSLPTTMAAITIPHYGDAGVLALAQLPMPKPGYGQVLIKVEAAGINRADILQRQGRYLAPPGASQIPGLEVAGEIVAAGAGVSQWQVGDLVCALLEGGGYAEYAVAYANLCLPIPAGVSVLDAAGLPEAAFTCYANLVRTANVQSGDWVLVQGGSSGIGTFAIQLLKAFGAHVITTVGSPEKAIFCKELGADVVINYKAEDFVPIIQEATNGQGVNIILDIIGQDYFDRHMEVLANHGRLVCIACLSGAQVQLNLLQLMRKQMSITGSTLRGHNPIQKALLAEQVRAHVWPLIAGGKIAPVTFQAMKLGEASVAHRIMESSRHIGKIILSTRDDI